MLNTPSPYSTGGLGGDTDIHTGWYGVSVWYVWTYYVVCGGAVDMYSVKGL